MKKTLRQKSFPTLERWTQTSFREVWRFQWNKIARDARVPLLWVVELLLGASIAASIAVYLDPDVNVVPFPWNGVAFLILAGLALWIHRQTRPFRVAQKVKKKRGK